MGFPVNIPDDKYRVANMGANNPATEISPESGWSGTFSALGSSISGGFARVSRALADYSTSTTDMSSIDANALGLTDEQAQSIQQGPTAVPGTDQIKAWQEWSKNDPRTVGSHAQLVGGVAQGLTIAAVGSLLGAPFGAATAWGAGTLGVVEGYNDYTDSREAGVDPDTALKKSLLTGGLAAAGMYLPMKMGSKTVMQIAGLGLEAEVAGNMALARTFYASAQAARLMTTLPGRLATGAAVNTGFGMASRYATSHVLESNGYPEMARQYEALDVQAIKADVVLGLAFGGWGHVEETFSSKPSRAPKAGVQPGAIEIQAPEFKSKVNIVDSTSYQGQRQGPLLGPNDQHLVAQDPTTGKDLGRLWITKTETGFEVRKVEVAPEARGQDVATQLYLEARAKFGIYEGSTERTADGQALIDRLKQTHPEIFEQGSLDPLHRPDPAMVEAALDVRREEIAARGAVGIPKDPATANLDMTLQENALADLLRGKTPEVKPEDAAAIIRGVLPDPQRIELADAWVTTLNEIHGDFGDFSQPELAPVKPVEPRIQLDLKPETTKAPPAEGAAKFSPVAEERLNQMALRHPDMDVVMPDGTIGRMSDLPQEIAKSMAKESENVRLVDAAVGCFLRGLL